ncbi:MAG: AraC family transcriptional regulator, partial [Alcanivorax sp.]|nr:AraC family transcriptional regulator [Alcanivorax sp.]
MNPEEYSASAEYVPVLVSLLERRGIAQDVLFQGTDIAPHCWREPGARVPVQHFEKLIRRAIELTGDAWLGWEFGAA